MTRKRLSLTLLLFFSLSACDDKAPDRGQSYSGQGLPDSQRTQEDSAAGVKFKGQGTFKSLSDPDQRE